MDNQDMPLWELLLLSFALLLVCVGLPMLLIFYVILPPIYGVVVH